MTSDITIEVFGEPVPWPRAGARLVKPRGKRPFIQMYTPTVRYVVSHKPNGEPEYGPDVLLPWKRKISVAARKAIPSGVISGFGAVEMDFYLPRTDELRKKKHPDCEIPCRSRYFGDADNLAKSVMDALTTTDAILRGDDKLGGIWGDDAEVWHLVVRKWYVARDEAGEWSPGVRIVIRAHVPEAAPALFAGTQAGATR